MRTAILGVLLAIVAGSLGAQAVGYPCPATVNVLTHRNNNYRTGANLQETCLTPDKVKPESFGKLFTYAVEGRVYAQPLIVTHLRIHNEANGGAIETHNVVFIATMENWVYAFDADGGNQGKQFKAPRPLWRKHLGPPLPVNRIPKDIGALLDQYNIEPYVGITSTPVIDLPANTMFLVAKIAVPVAVQVDCGNQVATADCPVENRIYAIDIRTGEVRDGVTIKLPPPEPEQTDPANKNPCRGYPDKRHPSDMDAARINLQRPALLLTGPPGKPHIYLGFGSHQDAPCPMYHGMVIRFDYDSASTGTRLTQFQPDHPFLMSKQGETDPPILGIFHDQKKLGKGGVWQAGNGPAADEDGNVYVMTGNGTYNPGEEFGSNFVRLNPALDENKVDWFAPSNVRILDTDTFDVDLGSSGPVLLPGTNQVVGGGKEGRLYLLNRASLGHKGHPVQQFMAARPWSVSVIYHVIPISLIPAASATGFHHIHGAPAFWGDPGAPPGGNTWKSSLYVWPERDHLKSFTYSKDSPQRDGRFDTHPAKIGPKGAPHGMPGGFLSISAAPGSDDGILWATLPLHDDAWVDIVRGELRAFHITRDGTKLDPIWTSYCTDENDRFNFAKYVPPTVANGRVYLATFSGFVSVYGPRQAPAGSKVLGPGCPVHETAAPGHGM